MSIVRCPVCRTAFRVRARQLETHAGMVRCGRCHAPFMGLEHLVEGRDTPPEHDTGRTPMDQPMRSRPPNAPRPFPGTPLPFRPADVDKRDRPASDAAHDRRGAALEFEIPDTLRPERGPVGAIPEAFRTAAADSGDRPAMPAAPSAGSDESSAKTSSRPPYELLIEWESTNPVPEAKSGDERSVAGDHLVHRADGRAPAETDTSAPGEPGATSRAGADSFDARLAVIRKRRAKRFGDEAASEAEAEPVMRATETVRDQDDAAPALPFQDRIGTRSERRWAWGLLIGILAGALAVQATYVFRSQITQAWPSLRPLFLDLCARFECTIPLPRIAGAITIEASELQSDPDVATRFVLSVVIRNNATHAQQLPHLELTLTGARDRALVRRVLTPLQWLPPEPTRDAFGAGEAIAAEIPFEAAALEGAVGYRVYAFYP